ncbi:helix-turn-helix domain-containing protein [Hydrogenophaga sp.]|uniref:helix-turn-helix domain-containing protein n=1 Tax=Hydrogenophaga sp. TaxID=1904254 RepID=UPI00271BCC40|nr:helix-turn-helix domain-containing protein [Hydrogenophaga sp.]MDO9504559.1 helix-turn-helix domain-containing protein [Hydrogenophaga sp.]
MPTTSSGHPNMPRQLFFQTPEQRTALARQRFFDEGARPSGLVGEAVLQSWMRCRLSHRDPVEPVSFEQVSRSRAHASLNRNRQLLQAGNVELHQLEAALRGTDCRVLLTDAQGVIIHATELPSAAQQPLLKTASRVGVNIAEHQIGTTAPGIVVRTGEACTVAGGEHYFQCLQTIHCAAAPIRDIHGQLAGVLDVSVEAGRFHFDPTSVVGMYAATIENRLLQLQSTQHLVLQFQTSPSLLDTPLEALAGIDADGRVLWLNGVAQRLTGCSVQGRPEVHEVFGLTLEGLLALHRQKPAQTLRLPNGLAVWIKGNLNASDGTDFNHAVALSAPAAPLAAEPVDKSVPNEAPARLVDHSQRLIETTLADCDGNIAKAARALGVSRGMLYRRLQKTRQSETVGAETSRSAPPA